MTFYQNGGRVFFSQSMATQADDKSPMVWTSEDIIDVFVLNSNLLNKHKHKHKTSMEIMSRWLLTCLCMKVIQVHSSKSLKNASSQTI